MSDIVRKISDFITGKDIDARHEELVKQVKSLESHYEAETLRLRADLSDVTAERDRMRTLLTRLYDAAGPLDADKMPADDFAQIITIVLDARAAIEGVTEPATGDINA